MNKLFRSILILIVLIPALLAPANNTGQTQRAAAQTTSGVCHFALAAPYMTTGYDLASLGTGGMLNWSVYPPANLGDNMDHIKVVRVSDVAYATHLANLPGWVAAYPGSVWVIGNEPDTVNNGQDGIYAELYAERFMAMATVIRNNDPTARIGFGPIVQPSPLRLAYLDRVIARLRELNGGNLQTALDLIDIYTPHAFVLNEEAGEWGANVPPVPLDEFGQPIYTYDAGLISVLLFDDTHDINLFKEWVQAYRDWLASYGEELKPVWITEYGSLLPPLDPSYADFENVSDAVTTAYMLETFDFLLAKNQPNGYALDQGRLVQRFYWFSLNEYRWFYGGSLFDPVTRQRTMVGDAYVNFDPQSGLVDLVNPDVYPVSVTAYPYRYSAPPSREHVDYYLIVRLDNNVSSDLRTHVTVNFSIGGLLLGTQSATLTRCGGSGFATFAWDNIVPNVPYTIQIITSLEPGSGVDINTTNNYAEFTITPGVPKLILLPVIMRP